MAGDGYQVMPSKLRDAAAAFKAQGDVIEEALARFHSAWRITDGSFGNMPNAKTMASRCQEIRDHISADLTKMHNELLAGHVKLAASATTYQATDEVVELYLWLISHARKQGTTPG